MQFSQEFRDKILKQTDLVDLISENIQLDQKGANYFGLCPFHNDTSPSMSVSPTKQIYKCFSCGAAGNAITFHMDYNNLSYSEALVDLANKAGISLPNDYTKYEKTKKQNPLVKSSRDINLLTTKLFNHFLKTTDDGIAAKNYLLNRGFNDEAIKKYMIGYIPKTHNDVFNFLKQKGYSEEEIVASGIALVNDSGYIDRFRSRIMFPLYDDNDHVVGFSGRVVGSGEPKYMNSPETVVFQKSSLLFNFSNAKQSIRMDKHVILMEGFMDVIKADIHGIHNCVAAMGTAFTDEQARKLRRATDHIYICFDGDKAGQNAALSSIKILRKFNFNIKVVNLEDNMDPDDFLSKYGKEEFLKALDQSKNIVEFQINKLYKDSDLDSEEAKAKFLKEAFKIIRTVGDDVAEKLYLDKLAKILSIDSSFVFSSYEANKDVSTEEIVPVDQNIEVQQRVFTATERAEQIILAAMIKDKRFSKRFEQDLGFLPTEEYNILAHYIVSFYKKYDTIVEANFISYLEDKRSIIEAFVWIINNIDEIFLSPASIEGCIKNIREYTVHAMIKELKDKISTTMDENEKLEYANKMFELQRKIKKY